MLHTLSLVFAAAAVLCLLAAIAGLVTERMSPRAGWMMRVFALACFVATVVLNIAAH